MRPAYFAWIFPSLLRQSKRAEERSDPAEMRAARRRAQVVADRIEVRLGAGSVVKLGGAGLAHAQADKIGALARLQDDLQDYAGQSCWGVGLTVREAEIARDYAAKHNQALAVYSPVLGGDLKKAEEGRPPIEPQEREDGLPIYQIEAELRDAADAYEAKQTQGRKESADRLAGARARAAAAIDELRAGGKLEEQAQSDPEAYQATMALIQATQEALAKGGTFKGLPVPRITRLKGSPVGTVLLGKIKVQTADGDKWRGARGGLVRDNQPEAEGSKVGAVVSARSAR